MSDELKPIDVTKPIETITGVPLKNWPVAYGMCAGESDVNATNLFDQFGRLLAVPSLGVLIRNVQPTDAEIVAERLARAAIAKPFTPTGLVNRKGEPIEMVTRNGGRLYCVAVRRDEIFTYGIPQGGCYADYDHPLDLLPAKDFQDE